MSINGGAHMVDEFDDEIDKPRTKHHPTAKDIPGDIHCTKKTHYQCFRCVKFFLCVQTKNLFQARKLFSPVLVNKLFSE